MLGYLFRNGVTVDIMTGNIVMVKYETALFDSEEGMGGAMK